MDQFEKFLLDLKDASCRAPLIESVINTYKDVFEGVQMIPLTVPDSIRSNAVLLPGTGIRQPVASASGGGVGGPSVNGAYKYSQALGNPSRDAADDTKEAFSETPKYPKQTVKSSVSVKKLIERSPSNDVGYVPMNASVMSSVPETGFTVKAGYGGNRGTVNGVDAGGTSGGGASSSAAQAS